MLIGVISDTHGLVRPEIRNLFLGVEMIIHAGDVGAPAVLETLRELAPIRAVRGNADKGAWAATLPETEVVEVEGCRIYVLHILKALDLDPVAAGLQVVISGHSHKASVSTKNGVLYLNPGSPGPRRFKLPINAALLKTQGPNVIAADIFSLDGDNWIRGDTWP